MDDQDSISSFIEEGVEKEEINQEKDWLSVLVGLVHEIQYNSVEEKRNRFGEGEWLSEPDFIKFEYLSLKCVIKRHELLGHLCGYCEVPCFHQWFGRKMEDLDCNVHGGVTYYGNLGHIGIDGGVYIGFDCMHSFDICPRILDLATKEAVDLFKRYTIPRPFFPTYKNISFCIVECMGLADQINVALGTKNE